VLRRLGSLTKRERNRAKVLLDLPKERVTRKEHHLHDQGRGVGDRPQQTSTQKPYKLATLIFFKRTRLNEMR